MEPAARASAAARTDGEGGAVVAGAKRHDEPRRSKKPKKHRKGRR
jgi:3'-phosphoadenosine 5'-phosphosulfate sulfotransferase (PAPS reductase)/FAD synthetase